MLKQLIATNDTSNPGLFLGILVVSGVVLIGYLLVKLLKKK